MNTTQKTIAQMKYEVARLEFELARIKKATRAQDNKNTRSERRGGKDA